MKIAVIGSGISGLSAAYLLSREHDVTVYESSERLGGHTATKQVSYQGESYHIDTGFIVFNDWTYPYFQTLLQQLGVASQPTEMGFSVSCENSGLEYSGNNLNTLFAQRRNLLKPSYWKMISDILRFNRQAPDDLANGLCAPDATLGEYLRDKHYSEVFIDKYLVPMGAAIWSSSTSAMKQFPLRFFIQFFKNHGLLSVNDRPQWHVIQGGSSSYIPPLVDNFKHNVRLNSPVNSIQRKLTDSGEWKVILETESGGVEVFDHVVVACHSDQALALLEDADDKENQILGAIAYKNNEVVLHTDTSLLPENKSTWSSWNYKITSTQAADAPPVLTYNMNILQNIDAPCTFCVTLNHTQAIDPEKVLGVYQYAHPMFLIESIKAQQRWEEINGQKNTWFCGAYWANGFHEDGLKSAVRIAEKFGISL